MARDDDNIVRNDASVSGGAVNVNECEVNADYRQQLLANDDVCRNDCHGLCDVVSIDDHQQQPCNDDVKPTMNDLRIWVLLIIGVVVSVL